MTEPLIACGDVSVDRETLMIRARRVAGGLAAMNVRPGDRVALLMRNSIDWLEITLAVGHVGAVPVPVNWHFTASEIAALLEDCTPGLIFVDQDLRGSLPADVAGRIPVIVVSRDGPAANAASLDYEQWREASPLHDGQPEPSGGSMVYTSGTTGRPKGVKRAAPTAAQREAMAKVRNQLYRIGPDARVLVPGPLYHAFPGQIATHAALHAAHVEIMDRFDPEEMLRIIECQRITSIGLAPIMFVRLLRLPEEVRARYDLSSIEWAIHAGGPCAPDVKQAMIDWWGPVIAEYYGGTETGPLTLCTSGEWLEHPNTCGRPIEGARIRIVDPQGGDVPVGEPGEIFGRLDPYPDFTYHNDPEKRRSVGLGDLVSLGDIGYQDDAGYLYLCDRARDMVVSGGVNIYPAEVEAALLALPEVSDCAVFGIPDREFGEALVAYVCGPGIDPGALKVKLRQKIAGYKVPRDLVVIAAIERDPSGKLRKARLREQYLARAGAVADHDHSPWQIADEHS